MFLNSMQYMPFMHNMFHNSINSMQYMPFVWIIVHCTMHTNCCMYDLSIRRAFLPIPSLAQRWLCFLGSRALERPATPYRTRCGLQVPSGGQCWSMLIEVSALYESKMFGSGGCPRFCLLIFQEDDFCLSLASFWWVRTHTHSHHAPSSPIPIIPISYMFNESFLIL